MLNVTIHDMKLALALMLAVFLAACTNRDKDASKTVVNTTARANVLSSQEDNTDAGAKQALKAIYSDVFSWYAKAEKDISILNKMPDFNAKYMSANYRNVLRQVTAKDKDCEEEGMVGFFDYDHWVCGQDFQNLSMDILNMSQPNADTRRFEVDITNLGLKKRIGIDLVYENGQWKIDDFRTDGSSEKVRMQEYVDEKDSDTSAASLDWSDQRLWFGGADRLSASIEKLPDVFYLLPTCVMDWTDNEGHLCHNADSFNPMHLSAWQLSAQLADTIFATRANLFLPYYRQVTFGGLQVSNSAKAYNMAVQDVLDAFDYYLKRYNHGRPFILAGYSQGGHMVKEILKHIDDDTYGRLIAAYVIGYGVTADDTITLEGHHTSHIKLANDSVMRGVTINFNSVTSVDAISPLLCDANIGCINPVSWTTDSTPAILLTAGADAQPDDPRFPYATGVAPLDSSTSVTVSVDTRRHVLLLKGIDASRYTFAGLENFFPTGNLHLQELFFYASYLRHNVLLRSGLS